MCKATTSKNIQQKKKVEQQQKLQLLLTVEHKVCVSSPSLDTKNSLVNLWKYFHAMQMMINKFLNVMRSHFKIDNFKVLTNNINKNFSSFVVSFFVHCRISSVTIRAFTDVAWTFEPAKRKVSATI